MVLISTFTDSLLQKHRPSIKNRFRSIRNQQCCTLIGSTAVMLHATVWLVMHVVFIFLLRIS